ncbi:MAG TPA: alpha/beta fold hydrolase [Steroidobacteraceae bacterium]|jgi:pimeloyl-ACP methyl ester carboxylesterase|nr:alpha/beta fold hydrolase [Steroidobacteraceae bacterium]
MPFILIPGAGGMASYWHRVVPLLEQAGHEAISVDLPADDARKGLDDYAEIVIQAIGPRSDVILVAQSLGGFTAPLVCASVAIRGLVFVNAMIPQPAETAGQWWGNTGAVEARIAAAEAAGYTPQFDLSTYFLHDVPEAVLRGSPSRPREQSDSIFSKPCRFARWPDIPLRVVAAADDRFFPLEFQRRVARERLGVEAEVIPGGHLVALSKPEGLVDLLLRFGRQVFG